MPVTNFRPPIEAKVLLTIAVTMTGVGVFILSKGAFRNPYFHSAQRRMTRESIQENQFAELEHQHGFDRSHE